MVAFSTLGRLGLAQGQETARAAGNSVVTTDVRGQRAAQPGKGNAIDESPVGGQQLLTSPSTLNRSTYARPTQNNRLVFRDRHILTRRGRTRSGREDVPTGGMPNPEKDGSPEPAYEQVNRTISWQCGTDFTTQLDNDAPHASTSAGGRRFPLGNQGSSPWERVDGGTPGLYRPYGARGYVMGPEPAQYALPGDGSGLRPGTLIAEGAQGDGPQLVFGGYPHGRHSPTVPATKVTKGRYDSTPQMVPGRQQRPAGSKIAGQSYSQTVVPQSGRGGGPLPEVAPSRQPGLNARWGRR